MIFKRGVSANFDVLALKKILKWLFVSGFFSIFAISF